MTGDGGPAWPLSGGSTGGPVQLPRRLTVGLPRRWRQRAIPIELRDEDHPGRRGLVGTISVWPSSDGGLRLGLLPTGRAAPVAELRLDGGGYRGTLQHGADTALEVAYGGHPAALVVGIGGASTWTAAVGPPRGTWLLHRHGTLVADADRVLVPGPTFVPLVRAWTLHVEPDLDAVDAVVVAFLPCMLDGGARLGRGRA